MSASLRDLIRNPSAAELELVARYGMLPEDPRRTRAFEAFAAIGLPHRRLEGWRWSDVKAALTGIDRPSSSPRQDPLAANDALTVRLTPQTCALPTDLPDGLTIRALPTVFAMGGAEDAPLGALAASLSGGKSKPAQILVEVTKPITPRLHFVFEGAGECNFGRIICLVRSGASINLSESYLGGAGLTASLIEITLEAKAHATRTLVQIGAIDEVAAVTAQIDLQAGAVYRQTTLGFGARLARLETRLTHSASASLATLNAAYLVAPALHADITTHVRHNAPACTTRQLTKGAVRKNGRGVFQGKFHVPRAIGQKTDASMHHHALLLEDGAQVFAKPELEIHADDVQCAHGNTSGALSDEQLFYARQRGLPEADARALLTEAFILEALVDTGTLEDVLRAAVANWFTQ